VRRVRIPKPGDGERHAAWGSDCPAVLAAGRAVGQTVAWPRGVAVLGDHGALSNQGAARHGPRITSLIERLAGANTSISPDLQGICTHSPTPLHASPAPNRVQVSPYNRLTLTIMARR
jgi:hypothetical protein